MHLARMILSNFRAYARADVAFPSHGVMLLAGPNNSGKSALLSSLDIVATNPYPKGQSRQAAGSTLQIPGMLRFAESLEPSSIKARFRLNREEAIEFYSSLSKDRKANLPVNEPPTDLEWEFIEWGPQLDQGTMYPLALKGYWVDPTVQDHSFLQIRREGSSVVYDPGPDRNGWSDIIPVPFELMGLPEASVAASYLSAWSANYYHLAPLRSGAKREQPLSSEPSLSPDGQNLAAVVLYLQTHRPDLWQTISAIMRRIVPDVGDLGSRPFGALNKIVARDPHSASYEPNLKDLGTGVEQLLMTVVVGASQAAPATVVIEEPETSLHPHAQRELLRLLRDEWGHDHLFVLSTHSPVFLDRAHGRASLVLTRRSDGISTVEELPSESTQALFDLGVRLSDVLSADRILLVEGPSDRAVLFQWFGPMLDNPNVEIIEAEGGDYARHVETLGAWLEAADRLGPSRRVLFLRDKDELPDRTLKRLKSPRIYTLQRREIENYLLDPAAIARVLESEYGIDVSIQQIGSTMRRAADALRSTVILKRVARNLEPIRLVDNRMRAELARSPSLERLQEEVASRCPNVDAMRRLIEESWRLEEKELNLEWNEHWADLAPGSAVLDALWKEYATRSYDKVADGAKIASAMHEPPDELREVLKNFLDD